MVDFKLEFFKEQYDKQQELRESMYNRFTILMSIVPLLFTAIFFCIKNINDLENHPIFFWLLIAFAIISVVLDVIILGLMFLHFKGETYLIIPRPSKWESVFKDCETYEDNQINPEAEDDFKKHLCNEYMKTSNHNWGVNRKRKRRLNLTHYFIMSSVISTILAVSCYFPSFFYDNANTQKVEITKTLKIQSEEEPDVKRTGK